MKEAVNHPDHYGGKDNPYEALKVMRAWMTDEEYRGFCRGNALKYLSRAGKKNPDKAAEDLRKAAFYIQAEVDSYV